MTVTIKRAPQPKKIRNGHAKALDLKLILHASDETKFRVGHLLSLLKVSSSTLYARIDDGRVPPPDGHNPRPYWKFKTVRENFKIDGYDSGQPSNPLVS